MKKYLLLLLLPCYIFAQNKIDTTPKVFGNIITWYQSDLQASQWQFVIKEARLGIKGNINEYFAYNLQNDFARSITKSDKAGDIDTLDQSLADAAVILNPISNLNFTMGQFVIPFGIENQKPASDQEFLNKSLIYKNISTGLRDIGVMGTYTTDFNIGLPMDFRLGFFNGNGQDKTETDKRTNVVFRYSVTPAKAFSLTGSAYSGTLSKNKVSILAGGAEYTINNIKFTSEVAKRTTTDSVGTFDGTAYYIDALYNLEISGSMITYLVPGIRFDYLEPKSTKASDEFSRLTTGLTLQFAKMHAAQFRINYEYFIYKDKSTNKLLHPSQLMFCMIAKF